MTDYARAQVQSERAQAAAEYKDLIEQHAAELEALREAARAELENVEDRYADLIDQ